MGIGTALFRFHRDVVNPERRGPLLTLARAGLWAAAGGYGLAVRARNGLYGAGWPAAQRADVPVISVGNITAGGTGKTPFVAWLGRLLVIRKRRPAVLSRGYGSRGKPALSDENVLLSRLVPEVPLVADADRVRGAEAAVRRHGADVLILDDGFQHRRIARDLDVVLIDALLPFGGGHLLPRGLLREPLGELARADFLVVTRANLQTPGRLRALRARLKELAPDTPVAECATLVHGLRPLRPHGGDPLGPEFLKGGRWAAFCGVGNPEGFRRTLEQAGCQLAFLSVYSDHEPYTRRQVAGVLDRAAQAGCDRIATTEKDAVKVQPLLEAAGAPHVYAVQTDLDFAQGAEELTAAILAAAQVAT